ncbi:MAG: hypothetical protein M1831_003060 [Alyxoria varia]|nr:MAG: hypothetical protein M1831_003060 [Alyxoria varia]
MATEPETTGTVKTTMSADVASDQLLSVPRPRSPKDNSAAPEGNSEFRDMFISLHEIEMEESSLEPLVPARIEGNAAPAKPVETLSQHRDDSQTVQTSSQSLRTGYLNPAMKRRSRSASPEAFSKTRGCPAPSLKKLEFGRMPLERQQTAFKVGKVNVESCKALTQDEPDKEKAPNAEPIQDTLDNDEKIPEEPSQSQKSPELQGGSVPEKVKMIEDSLARRMRTSDLPGLDTTASGTKSSLNTRQRSGTTSTLDSMTTFHTNSSPFSSDQGDSASSPDTVLSPESQNGKNSDPEISLPHSDKCTSPTRVKTHDFAEYSKLTSDDPNPGNATIDSINDDSTTRSAPIVMTTLNARDSIVSTVPTPHIRNVFNHGTRPWLQHRSITTPSQSVKSKSSQGNKQDPETLKPTVFSESAPLLKPVTYTPNVPGRSLTTPPSESPLSQEYKARYPYENERRLWEFIAQHKVATPMKSTEDLKPKPDRMREEDRTENTLAGNSKTALKHPSWCSATWDLKSPVYTKMQTLNPIVMVQLQAPGLNTPKASEAMTMPSARPSPAALNPPEDAISPIHDHEHELMGQPHGPSTFGSPVSPLSSAVSSKTETWRESQFVHQRESMSKRSTIQSIVGAMPSFPFSPSSARHDSRWPSLEWGSDGSSVSLVDFLAESPRQRASGGTETARQSRIEDTLDRIDARFSEQRSHPPKRRTYTLPTVTRAPPPIANSPLSPKMPREAGRAPLAKQNTHAPSASKTTTSLPLPSTEALASLASRSVHETLPALRQTRQDKDKTKSRHVHFEDGTTPSDQTAPSFITAPTAMPLSPFPGEKGVVKHDDTGSKFHWHKISTTPLPLWPYPDTTIPSLDDDDDASAQQTKSLKQPVKQQIKWAATALTILTNMTTLGLSLSYGSFLAWYAVEKFAATPIPTAADTPSIPTIAAIGTLQISFLVLVNAILTHFVVINDARRGRQISRLFTLMGTALVVSGLLGTGFAAGAGTLKLYLALQGVYVGAGMGVLTAGVNGVVSLMLRYQGRVSKNRLCVDASMTGASVGAGALLYTLIFQQCIEHWGFDWTVGFMTLIVGLKLAVVNIVAWLMTSNAAGKKGCETYNRDAEARDFALPSQSASSTEFDHTTTSDGHDTDPTIVATGMGGPAVQGRRRSTNTLGSFSLQATITTLTALALLLFPYYLPLYSLTVLRASGYTSLTLLLTLFSTNILGCVLFPLPSSIWSRPHPTTPSPTAANIDDNQNHTNSHDGMRGGRRTRTSGIIEALSCFLAGICTFLWITTTTYASLAALSSVYGFIVAPAQLRISRRITDALKSGGTIVVLCRDDSTPENPNTENASSDISIEPCPEKAKNWRFNHPQLWDSLALTLVLCAGGPLAGLSVKMPTSADAFPKLPFLGVQLFGGVAWGVAGVLGLGDVVLFG